MIRSRGGNAARRVASTSIVLISIRAVIRSGARGGDVNLILAGTALALVIATSAGTAAHHSFAAEFDRNKPITVTGVVTKLDWVNPHVFLYVDVTDGKGFTAN